MGLVVSDPGGAGLVAHECSRRYCESLCYVPVSSNAPWRSSINIMTHYDTNTATQLAARNFGISCLSLLAASTAVYQLFATPVDQRQLKALYAGVGLVTAGSGLLASRNTREMLDISSTIRDVSRVVRANDYYAQMSLPRLPQTAPEVFSWSDVITKPDVHPHLLLLGASGDGKTTLAEYLVDLLSPSKCYAVVPHWQVGDFTGARVVGKERYLGDGFDGDPTTYPSLYAWADIEQAAPDAAISACELLHALYWEMDRRYKLDSSGKFTGSSDNKLVVVLDEFLSYALLPGVKQLWRKLVREARKVKIRLVILVQGDGVASLGIEGEGDLRESLTYVYLKNFALSHLEQCYNRATVERRPYYDWVRQQFRSVRPCMVEDLIAHLPQPENRVNETRTQEVIKGNVRGRPELHMSVPPSGRTRPVIPIYTENASEVLHTKARQSVGASPEVVDSGRSRAERTVVEQESSGGNIQGRSGTTGYGNVSAQFQTVADSKPRADDFLEGYDEVVSSLTPEQLDTTLRNLWDVAVGAAKEDMPSGAPMTQEAIIKKVWGYESYQYHTGKVLWALAITRYGRINLR